MAAPPSAAVLSACLITIAWGESYSVSCSSGHSEKTAGLLQFDMAVWVYNYRMYFVLFCFVFLQIPSRRDSDMRFSRSHIRTDHELYSRYSRKKRFKKFSSQRLYLPYRCCEGIFMLFQWRDRLNVYTKAFRFFSSEIYSEMPFQDVVLSYSKDDN